MRVCIVGASGRPGRYMVGHALDHAHEVVAVCREQSVAKLAADAGRITIVPGPTDGLVHEAPAIVGRESPSALAHAQPDGRGSTGSPTGGRRTKPAPEPEGT